MAIHSKEFQISIDAPAKKVWFALWDDYHYRQWTSVFCENGYAIHNNWAEGGKVHFLSPSGDGMYSVVTLNKPLEKMYFTHIGDLKNFEEQPLDDAAQQWTGARENYTLSENNGQILLTVQMDIVDTHLDYFEETFPKALNLVKQLAENFYITVQASVNAPIEKVWDNWTNPAAIVQWNSASDEWHTPKASNDMRVGGKYSYRMEAKDGSMGFDLEGIYTQIIPHQSIEHSLADDRKVKIQFQSQDNITHITESFEGENVHPYELQRDGWQAILNNFVKFTAND
jgi:uncharacterized protein YndB with AHSA1/START domain